MKTVIVGGVAGGASAAARLRRLDERGEIVLLERGEYISFANCGLPYYVGGEITEKSALTLQTPESFYNRSALTSGSVGGGVHRPCREDRHHPRPRRPAIQKPRQADSLHRRRAPGAAH